MIGNELQNLLMSKGLTKQQAQSMTAEVCINALMPDDGKVLLDEARFQVTEMKKLISSLQAEYRKISDALLSVVEAQKDYGVITDERGKNALALYASVMALNEKYRADADKSVKVASYVTWAYLTGNNIPETFDKDIEENHESRKAHSV